jgi:hypothetical protein
MALVLVVSLVPARSQGGGSRSSSSAWGGGVTTNKCPSSPGSMSGSAATPSRKKCWALGDPPYIKHGKFRSVEFMRHYPLKPAFFQALVPPPSFDALLPMLNKLASGGKVDIVLVGGSMPLGKSCMQEISSFAGHDIVVHMANCSWGARFAEWLDSAFPIADVVVRNMAVGGMGVSFFAADVSRYVNEKTDLVIIDTFANDMAAIPTDATVPSDADAFGTTSTAAALESFVLSVKERFPHAALLDTLVIADWGIIAPSKFKVALKAHEIVMSRYGGAVFHLTNIISDHEDVWPSVQDVLHSQHWSFESLRQTGPPKNRIKCASMSTDAEVTACTARRGAMFNNVVHPHWTT